ncbi:MAG: ATP-binding protein [Candidatus Paceibacterota bacterium]
MNFLYNTIYNCSGNLGSTGTTLLYLHIPVSVLTLIIALYIWKQSKHKASSKIIIYIALTFALWVILNNIVWLIAASASVYLFAWSLIEPVSIVLFLLMYYFVYTYVYNKDLPYMSKYTIIITTAPFIFLSFTKFNIASLDLNSCLPVENISYLYYGFALKVFFTLLSIFYLFYAIYSNEIRKKETVTLSIGVLSFILSFFISGYVSENVGNYIYEFYSLFGVGIFLICISALIVKFKVFNIKGLGVQMIIFLQVFFVASQLLFFRSREDLIVILMTLAISIVFGLVLFYSVKKEFQQKQLLEVQSRTLLKMNKRLETKDKLRSEFMLLASHQLRSPLTALRGYASMIREKSFGEYSEKLEEPIDRIYESATHLNNVVTDLLSISKIELGGLTYSMQIFDVKRMVKDIVTEMQNMAENKKIYLKYSDSGEILYLVKGDVEKLRQAIINVIDNAIKYTSTGGVEVYLDRDESFTQIKVKDTGVGIKKEDVPNLFKKFSRVGGVGINRSGSGVGLYLVKKIIDAHDGKIDISSEGDGKGSTFVVVLHNKEK